MVRLVALISVLLIGFYLRVHDLATLPPGLSPDEAHVAVEALRLADTGSSPFFTDIERPESLDIVPWAAGILLFGPTTFAVRLMTAYIGLLAVAATYRAGRDLFRGLSRYPVWAGVVAAAALATFAWHVALSRHLYRGVHLNVTQALFISQLALALWNGRRRHFALAGLWLGGSLYTYTAARTFVVCLPGLLLFLLIVDRRLLWRQRIGWLWLFGLFGLLLLPLGYVALTTPAVLIARAQDVAGGSLEISTLLARAINRETLSRVVQLVFIRGASNPQYNVPHQPLVAGWLGPALGLGLLNAAARIARWQFALLWLLWPLMLAPVILGGEVPHGLREVGLFVPAALLIGWAAAQVADWLRRQPWPPARAIWAGSVILAVGLTGLRADQAYHDFWPADVDGNLWWFFAYDRVAAAAAIRASEQPLYVPVSALQHPVIRYLTAPKYRRVKTFEELPPPYTPARLPLGKVLIPIIPPEEPFPADWPSATQYALLLPADDTIYLLPRLAPDSAQWLKAELLARAVKQFGPDAQLFGMGFELSRLNPFENAAPVAQPANVNFDQALILTGWDGPRILTPGNTEHFTLYWSVIGQPPADSVVFLQLVDEAGQRLGGDDVWALKHLFPSGLWRPAQRVPDEHSVRIPVDLAPGRYWLSVGVYPPFRALLPVVADSGQALGDHALTGPVKIPAPPVAAAPATLFPADFGPLRLLGYDLSPKNFAPGQTLTFTFYWQAVESMSTDYTAFLHVQAGEALVGQADVQPGSGRYPTSIWDAGEVVTTIHAFSLATDAPPGPYTVYLGWYAWPSGERLIGAATGQPAGDGRVLVGRWP